MIDDERIETELQRLTWFSIIAERILAHPDEDIPDVLRRKLEEVKKRIRYWSNEAVCEVCWCSLASDERAVFNKEKLMHLECAWQCN